MQMRSCRDTTWGLRGARGGGRRAVGGAAPANHKHNRRHSRAALCCCCCWTAAAGTWCRCPPCIRSPAALLPAWPPWIPCPWCPPRAPPATPPAGRPGRRAAAACGPAHRRQCTHVRRTHTQEQQAQRREHVGAVSSPMSDAHQVEAVGGVGAGGGRHPLALVVGEALQPLGGAGRVTRPEGGERGPQLRVQQSLGAAPRGGDRAARAHHRGENAPVAGSTATWQVRTMIGSSACAGAAHVWARFSTSNFVPALWARWCLIKLK